MKDLGYKVSKLRDSNATYRDNDVRMRNRKMRNIRPSWGLLTGNDEVFFYFFSFFCHFFLFFIMLFHVFFLHSGACAENTSGLKVP
jgi:hypothetical protein